jgi:hypothetical protein
MLAGIASLARNVPKIFRGTKIKPRTNLSDLKNVLTKHITKENPIDMGSEVAAMDADPKYQMIGGGIEGSGPSIYRGTTLIDDPAKISTKKQMNVLRDDEKFFTDDPIEAAHHGYSSQSVDNPAVILRMAREIANTRSPKTPLGRNVLAGGHSIVSNQQDAMIPVLMNVITRLKKMGWKDAEIFKYIKLLYQNPIPKKIFNRGGIVSLML